MYSCLELGLNLVKKLVVTARVGKNSIGVYLTPTVLSNNNFKVRVFCDQLLPLLQTIPLAT